jgi:preprotein translocase subunit SecE
MNWNPVSWYSVSVQFLSDVRAEYRKVTWPSRKEAIAGTIGVVVLVAIMTGVLSLVDLVLSSVIQLILP